MNLPKIDPDDVLLFGSIGLVAIGAALVTARATHDSLLAFGMALIVFGLPSALLTFMAASEESQ